MKPTDQMTQAEVEAAVEQLKQENARLAAEQQADLEAERARQQPKLNRAQTGILRALARADGFYVMLDHLQPASATALIRLGLARIGGKNKRPLRLYLTGRGLSLAQRLDPVRADSQRTWFLAG